MAELALNIDGDELAAETKGRRVECLVCIIGFVTACMAIAAAIYKAPSGIFDDHKRAYYVSVVSAGVAGLVEVFAGVIWLSGGHRPHGLQGRQQQQRLARRCVLCASFLPLAFMAGLGGVRMLVK